MGRFDAFSQIIRMAFDAVGIEPRPWMAVMAFLIGGVLLYPSLRDNARTARARKLLPTLIELEPDERTARAETIIELVEGNAQGLVSIADKALEHGHRPIAVRAYESLRQTKGAPRADLVRLDEALFGAAPRHPEAEAAAVERLVEAGALLRAEQRMRRARAWFPQDPALAALDQQLRELAAGAGEPRPAETGPAETVPAETGRAEAAHGTPAKA